MKVLVCGGRDFGDELLAFRLLNRLHQKYKFSTVIEGGAKGAAKIANSWAQLANLPVRTYYANLEQHGNAAVYIRNSNMLHEENPEIVIVFPGGRTTVDMAVRALKYKSVKTIILAHRDGTFRELPLGHF